MIGRSPCTVTILGVDPEFLETGPGELREQDLHRYWDFLWSITDGHIQVVLEHTALGISATAVHFVEAGYDYRAVDSLDRVISQLPGGAADIAMVVCRRPDMQEFASRLCPHAASVKTIEAPSRDRA